MAALTDVDIANQALQMIGSRSQITSFTDGSKEAVNVNLVYNRVRDQVMTMAWWNFARRMELLSLLKASYGTPENTSNVAPWDTTQPAPPWLYEYRYPNDCLLMRYVIPQPNAQATGTSAPIFSVNLQTSPWWPGPPGRFIVAQDFNVRSIITAITKANPIVISSVNTFANGDRVTITDVSGMIELNANSYLVAAVAAGSFSLTDLNGTNINSTNYTTYVSGGYASAAPIKCVLNNIEYSMACYMAQIVDCTMWPTQFVNAFAAALGGFLAYPISGKLDLKKMCLEESNMMIIEARKSDGDEGFTTQDSTPDWIRVRGINYPQYWDTPFIAAYPPLFSVS